MECHVKCRLLRKPEYISQHGDFSCKMLLHGIVGGRDTSYDLKANAMQFIVFGR